MDANGGMLGKVQPLGESMKRTGSGIVAILIGACSIVAGCSTSKPPETALHVDLARYMGKWYEIARKPVYFEKGLVNVTAEYTLRDDGNVMVVNRGFKQAANGPERSIEGTASVADRVTDSKLKVRFKPFPVNLFKANYWIIEVGPDYEYAVVSNAHRSVLWILSRTRAMDPAAYERILKDLQKKGFDTSKLILTPQS